MTQLFEIAWADGAGKKHRWLHADKDFGNMLPVHHQEKATKLTREEVNEWLLKLLNSPGSWKLRQFNAWPHVIEVKPGCDGLAFTLSRSGTLSKVLNR
jgi:hypothetical protein